MATGRHPRSRHARNRHIRCGCLRVVAVRTGSAVPETGRSRLANAPLLKPRYPRERAAFPCRSPTAPVTVLPADNGKKRPRYVASQGFSLNIPTGEGSRFDRHLRRTDPPPIRALARCALRLSVRTPPFHGGERGSTPLGRASTSSSSSGRVWDRVGQRRAMGCTRFSCDGPRACFKSCADQRMIWMKRPDAAGSHPKPISAYGTTVRQFTSPLGR